MRRLLNKCRQGAGLSAWVLLGTVLLACSAQTTSAKPSSTPDQVGQSQIAAASPTSALPETLTTTTSVAPTPPPPPDDRHPLVPVATADPASQRSSCFERSLGVLTLYDAANGTYLAFGVNPASPSYGRWSFAVEGVGVVWPETPTLPMDTSSDALLKLSYSGPGEIDRLATMEFLRYGIFEFSGERRTDIDRNRWGDRSVGVDSACLRHIRVQHPPHRAGESTASDCARHAGNDRRSL